MSSEDPPRSYDACDRPLRERVTKAVEGLSDAELAAFARDFATFIGTRRDCKTLCPACGLPYQRRDVA